MVFLNRKQLTIFSISDFVFSEKSSFQFTQKYTYPRISVTFLKFYRLISDGYARPFTAHAMSPTITMPRVKAITTGSVPGFLDVILNFAESDTSSTLAQQDTWLAQIKASGGQLVMYGDDTWIKLFPESFHRSDGTSSFFVAVRLSELDKLFFIWIDSLYRSRILPKLTIMSQDISTLNFLIKTGT